MYYATNKEGTLKEIFAVHISNPSSEFTLNILHFMGGGQQCDEARNLDMSPTHQLSDDGERIRRTDMKDAQWATIKTIPPQKPESVEGKDHDGYFYTDDPDRAYQLIQVVGAYVMQKLDKRV
jgi:hypothetical protein